LMANPAVDVVLQQTASISPASKQGGRFQALSVCRER
jgi:hypothetical protein